MILNRGFIAIGIAVAIAGGMAGAGSANDGATWKTVPQVVAQGTVPQVEAYLDGIRREPGRLREFISDLPKGTDLHAHLSGAVPTEFLLHSAERDGLCIDITSFTASAAPCNTGQRPARDATTDAHFADEILRAWSMRGFTPGTESGHDHFFAAFGKFGAASSHKGEMLAAFASQAAAQHEFALEVMLSRQSTAVQELVKKVGAGTDLARLHSRLLADGAMAKIVKAARADADADIAQMRTGLRCGRTGSDPGCELPLRFLLQVTRTAAPEVVFGQMVLGFELAKADKRYVGVNLVAPEDDPVALRDYRLQMRMLGYLHSLYFKNPKAHITLHAGELAPGLAPAADLRFHIRDAVETGHAERIGHGVDVSGEDDPEGLLTELARKHVLIEIALTSNCQILKVCGAQHPFAAYRRAGVPVALVTDDAGIEHTDMTSEYIRAVTDYGLHYTELRTLARTALDHSFLQGRSLWRAPDDHTPATECAGSPLGGAKPATACRALLKGSAKARAEWKQEAAFTAFEDRYDG
ncbi:adenosine deaminase [Streptosporangium album]|uniref:adenosine deaminase n=1 Tax=Streptosporangium album TaxID=47479 RepID=A0A7W7RTG8_9ACTN|nr:adenosine deaminase [Streptosporangium album]MBB4937181.1 adenosine deaminase [Streptosporangium album]